MIGQTTTLRSGTAFLLRPPSIESFVADNTPEHRFARLSLSVSAQAIIHFIATSSQLVSDSVPFCTDRLSPVE
jgi:hypothetical protein